MEKIIVTFNSTRDAINAERLSLSNGITCQAIPVPRGMTAECGIALECRSRDKEVFAALMNREKIIAVFHDP